MRTTNRPIRRHAAAFSLVELAMVMVVISIMTAIVAPRYGRSLDRYRADSIARRMAADIELVQAEARAARSPRAITFDVDQNRYQVSNTSDPPYRTVEVDEVIDDAELKAVTLGQSEPHNTLTFNGHGMPDSGGSVTVSVASQERTITVNAYTGRASFQ